MSRHRGPRHNHIRPVSHMADQIKTIQANLQSSKDRADQVNYARGFRAPIVWPDQRLTTPAADVHAADITALQALAERPGQALLSDSAQALLECLDCLTFTCNALKAGGLAAPQIGVPLRVVVVKMNVEAVPATATEPARPACQQTIHLINPQIVTQSGAQVTQEGCLSIPDVRLMVGRFAQVLVRATGLDGGGFEIGGDGLLAVVLQHEIDHLDGKMIVDGLSALRRGRIRDEMVKRKRRNLHYECPAQPVATAPPAEPLPDRPVAVLP